MTIRQARKLVSISNKRVGGPANPEKILVFLSRRKTSRTRTFETAARLVERRLRRIIKPEYQSRLMFHVLDFRVAISYERPEKVVALEKGE